MLQALKIFANNKYSLLYNQVDENIFHISCQESQIVFKQTFDAQEMTTANKNVFYNQYY